jgi:lipoprotein-releasing system permease protein
VLGFRSFVATRYLFVPLKAVTPTTRRLILITFGVMTLLYLAMIGAVEMGWAELSLKSPLVLAACGSTIALLSIIVGAVLLHSKPAMGALLTGIVLMAIAYGWFQLVIRQIWFHYDPTDLPKWLLWALGITFAAGALLFLCSLFFGMLRAFFSFFTTVSIGGVYIGTAALVCVLSVMSGFESDLREKILGSNAHIQVSREDGDFTEWREVKGRIDAIPGVVASTPYAVSEVVIAANSNGMNVIIKGIDPKSVGSVTELVKDLEPIGNPLEQIETLKRLEPLISDQHDLNVAPAPVKKRDHVMDPAPADMPSGGDPIDFTQPTADPDASAGSGSGSGGAPIPPSDFGGTDVVDPPPADLLTTDDAPLDLSKPSTDPVDPTVHVVDIPSDQPMLSRRTQTLPGILVGRELVKQTHLYTGEEVRVVSPLSDPSNPDATGTPIPFNRDYRVAGIFFTGMYEYDLKYVYVTLDSLNEFLDRGDTVDGIEVRVTSPNASGAYVEKIKTLLGPQYRVQDWNDLNRSLFSALELEKIAMFLVLGIVILVASFSIVGNLIMIVVEKAREIALLKTLGGGDGSIMLIFVIQGLLIGLVGVALGLHTGLIFCWLGKHIGIPLNPDVYYIDRMPIHVEWPAVAVIAAAGVLISLVATVYPALVAGQVRPAAGMRH